MAQSIKINGLFSNDYDKMFCYAQGPFMIFYIYKNLKLAWYRNHVIIALFLTVTQGRIQKFSKGGADEKN